MRIGPPDRRCTGGSSSATASAARRYRRAGSGDSSRAITEPPRGSSMAQGSPAAPSAAVAAGVPPAATAEMIDPNGMSATPGSNDAHSHINTAPNEKAQMQALLEAGYTTALSGGGPADGNITLRDHIEKGVINGPRSI